MDCGFLKLAARANSPTRSNSPVKSKSLRTQLSLKYADADAAEEREWPVEAESYEVVKELGKGAHAAVYYARCADFDEPVAIKKIDLDNSNWNVEALERETGLMRKFHHPNVLPLYTAFVAGRELWMVMPVMGHGSVRSIMKQKYPAGLDEVVIATIMYQVLLGLEYVHKNQGIHRDIKADNILLSESGDVCLADFGVAATRTRVVSRINMDTSVVMATTFVGTPCWMAPEVMQQEDGYNSSADIWSFGITLLELATGKPPMARLHPVRVLMDTIRNPPPSLDAAANGRSYSQALHELVDLCLQKNPDDRPSAATLLKHRFFKAMARDSDFLAQHFLHDVQPVIPNIQGAVAASKAPAATAKLGSFLGASGASMIKSMWFFPADSGAKEQSAASATAGGTAGGFGRVPSAVAGARLPSAPDGGQLAPGLTGAGSFLVAPGAVRLRSTYHFPPELPSHQEAEGDEEEAKAPAAAGFDVQTATQPSSQKVGDPAAEEQTRSADDLSAGNPASTTATGAQDMADSNVSSGAADTATGSSVLEVCGDLEMSPAGAAAATDISSCDELALINNEQQQDAGVRVETPTVEVEVRLCHQQQQGSPGKHKSAVSTAAEADTLSRSPGKQRGMKLLKEFSDSMKALLLTATSGKHAGAASATADQHATEVENEYLAFVTKPRLARGRP